MKRAERDAIHKALKGVRREVQRRLSAAEASPAKDSHDIGVISAYDIGVISAYQGVIKYLDEKLRDGGTKKSTRRQ